MPGSLDKDSTAVILALFATGGCTSSNSNPGTGAGQRYELLRVMPFEALAKYSLGGFERSAGQAISDEDSGSQVCPFRAARSTRFPVGCPTSSKCRSALYDSAIFELRSRRIEKQKLARPLQ